MASHTARVAPVIMHLPPHCACVCTVSTLWTFKDDAFLVHHTLAAVLRWVRTSLASESHARLEDGSITPTRYSVRHDEAVVLAEDALDTERRTVKMPHTSDKVQDERE